MFDGEYDTESELYNEKKCYHNVANENYKILWEPDVLNTGGWIITDADGPKFFSPDDVPCPDLAHWVFLPDGLDTSQESFVAAEGITFGGLTGMFSSSIYFEFNLSR